MSKVITIKKGLNIQLAGKAERIITKASQTGAVALKPTDFTGLTPKLSVKQGDEVKVGTPIFFNKYNPQIKFTSPVSGKVSAINRGDRRKILEIVIEPDGKNESLDFIKASPAELSREQIINTLLESGLWPLLRQRPYSTIAKPEHSPKAIFISAFDTAPLAPDYAFIAKEEAQLFQLGLDAIAKLTDGKVYLNIPAESSESDVFQNAKNVEITQFKGKHPTGNVGVQIHYLTPINKGETVWYINPADLIIIGRLFATGKLDFSRTIAVTGSEVKQPRYVKTILGASVKTVTSDNIKEGNVRYISGNVLTGTQVILHGYVGFYDYQLTAIPEGDYYEFLGWGTPGFGKYSMSRAFFSWLQPKREFRLDTNYHGGERAFVLSDQYNKVFPMDIYPVHLLKAILAKDIEAMENLGIYEVAEEDFALCEFVCTSKIEVQSIVRKGIELMIKEVG